MNIIPTLPMVSIHFHEVESTYKWCISNMKRIVIENGVTEAKFIRVTTDLQLNGIGQCKMIEKRTHYKRWIHQRGNIACCYIFFMKVFDSTHFNNFSLVIASVIINVIGQYGIQALFKLLNDVIVNDKKIAGILCSTVSLNSYLKEHVAFVAGIGLNVEASPYLTEYGIPDYEQQNSTCIIDEIKCKHNSSKISKDSKNIYQDVINCLTVQLWKAFSNFKSCGVELFIHHLNAVLYKKNYLVRIQTINSFTDYSNNRKCNNGSVIHKELGICVLEGLCPVTGNIIVKQNNCLMQSLSNINIVYLE